MDHLLGKCFKYPTQFVRGAGTVRMWCVNSLMMCLHQNIISFKVDFYLPPSLLGEASFCGPNIFSSRTPLLFAFFFFEQGC
mmetsp:Transcript_40073/g.66748  ORF Transcript_40073/g.66748 Transcript_40073/m.66748 type:complete len:81 (-) Transcript_40073:126-368(-)